jgi:hypothetical protein
MTDIVERLRSLWDTRPPHAMAVLIIVILVSVLVFIATAVGDWSVMK